MKAFDPKGTGVALVTPFLSNGSIDWNGLRNLIRHVTKGGVEFLVVLGTTAESATLSTDEKQQLIQAVLEENKGQLPVVLGVGGNNTAALVKQLETLDTTGISAILSVAPYYNKPTQAGIIAHFKALEAASPLPIILYNVPGRTSSNISAASCLELAHYSKRFIAVKEASGNMTQIMEILKGAPAHFSVLSGDDNLTLSMMALGARGVISVSGQLEPEIFSQMVRDLLYLRLDDARKKHFKLFRLTELLFAEGNPAGVKAALALKGICEPHVRLPLVPASPILTQELSSELASLNVS